MPPSPLLLLPLSQVSDRTISAPMIAVGVLAWQLSRRWQEPGSVWELILPLLLRPSPSRRDDRQKGRETDRQTEKEREEDDSYHPPSFTNPLSFSNQTISMTVRHSHFANCSPKTFNFRCRRPAADGWKRLVCEGICCNLTPRPESSTPGYYAFAPHCHGSLNFFDWGIGGDGEVGEVGCTGREWV